MTDFGNFAHALSLPPPDICIGYINREGQYNDVLVINDSLIFRFAKYPAGLLYSFGESFLAQCARYYPEIEAASGRIRFYFGTFALQEALFGVENGDQEAFANGMQAYA